jgi:hypothetical protein
MPQNTPNSSTMPDAGWRKKPHPKSTSAHAQQTSAKTNATLSIKLAHPTNSLDFNQLVLGSGPHCVFTLKHASPHSAGEHGRSQHIGTHTHHTFTHTPAQQHSWNAAIHAHS